MEIWLPQIGCTMPRVGWSANLYFRCPGAKCSKNWFYRSPGHITGMKMTEAKGSQVKITMNCRCKILLLVTVGALIEGSAPKHSFQCLFTTLFQAILYKNIPKNWIKSKIKAWTAARSAAVGLKTHEQQLHGHRWHITIITIQWPPFTDMSKKI